MFNGLRRARADITTMNRLFPAAERIAHRDGADEPGAEHLLLAALDLPDGVALDVLSANGVDRDHLSDAIAGQHAEALRSVGIAADDNAIDALLPHPSDRPAGVYRSTASARALFGRATDLAKAEPAPLGSGHVLLAATELDHGTLARVFEHLGVDRALLADRIRAVL